MKKVVDTVCKARIIQITEAHNQTQTTTWRNTMKNANTFTFGLNTIVAGTEAQAVVIDNFAKVNKVSRTKLSDFIAAYNAAGAGKRGRPVGMSLKVQGRVDAVRAIISNGATFTRATLIADGINYSEANYAIKALLAAGEIAVVGKEEKAAGERGRKTEIFAKV